MALASLSCISSSNALLDLTTTSVRCSRPLSANLHRPLRFPCARSTPSLQLKSALPRWVASAASPPSTLERNSAAEAASLHSKPALEASGLQQPLHSPSSWGLENVVQHLEETFRDSPNGELAKRWREFHGCSNWDGLLDPLDPDLRAEILKYGDLAQLTYDAFDNQEHSHTRGDCLYEEQELLQRAGFTWASGYTVTKYIYATSDVHVLPKWLERHGGMKGRESSWMGFVAVANDEKEIARLGRRDIVVVWRGTVTRLEWLENVDGAMIDPIHTIDERHVDPKCHFGVERGFYTLYTSSNIDAPHGHTSAAEQVRQEVKRLVDMYGGEENQLSITMTGHSLGGALALLAAYDVASTGVSKEVPVSVISFAAPRLGNEAFKRRLEEVGVKVLRVVNTHDMVPKVPGFFVHEASSTSNVASSVVSNVDSHGHDCMWNTYVHVGVKLCLDNNHSPFLKKKANLVDSHNLDLYLHLVDGYRSAKVPFIGLRAKARHLDIIFKGQHDDHQLNHVLFCMRYMKRDVAFVNRTTGLLLDELHVPPNWQANKLPKPSPSLSPSTLTTSSTRITSRNVVPKLLHSLTRTNLLMA